jgi:peptide/nickel transport system permease protein
VTIFRRFFSHWQNWLGVFLLLGFVSISLMAPVLSPMDLKNPGPFKTIGRVTDLVPHPPDEKALLGTLPGQIDVYHTLIWGTRDAMQFGLVVAIGAFLFGVLFGAVSGYTGGILNSFMMRLSDAFLTFPLIAGVAILQQLVAITIESMGGTFYFNIERFGKVVYFEFVPPAWVDFLLKVDPLLICLIIFSWVPYARLVNTLVITLKRSEFIQAAQALGGGPFWIIRRHLLPNSIGPALVLAARDVGNAVILQATFTFIGMGSVSSWGLLLSMGRNWIIGPGGNVFKSWWVFLPATLAVMLFGITWNIIGDGLSDAIHPDSKIRRLRVKEDQAKQEIPSILSRSVQPGISIAASRSSTRPETPGPVRNSIILQTARDAVIHGSLSKALEAYSFLVRRSRLLDTVVKDLTALARLFPGEPKLWKILGDALASSGNQAYADKAYVQADLVLKKQGQIHKP